MPIIEVLQTVATQEQNDIERGSVSTTSLFARSQFDQDPRSKALSNVFAKSLLLKTTLHPIELSTGPLRI